MKIGVYIYIKDVNEQAKLVVLCNNRCRDFYCLVVGCTTVLFFDGLALQGAHFRAVDD